MSMSTLLTEAPPTTTALPAELARLLSRIGRGLRYRTRTAREALDVTQSESDLLKLLERRPGIRVYEAALELGVASNSVSTLVKQLNRVGLLERTADPLDGRAACLRLTPMAMEWVLQVGNAREEAIDRALLSLDDSDREVIEAAIPALKRFAKAIASRGSSAQ
jgi:DNA-binding MarR family transcriptional regulator